jgi:hypothetical protein
MLVKTRLESSVPVVHAIDLCPGMLKPKHIRFRALEKARIRGDSGDGPLKTAIFARENDARLVDVVGVAMGSLCSNKAQWMILAYFSRGLEDSCCTELG